MSTRRLATLLVTLTLLLLYTAYITATQPAQIELEVIPPTGRGRYGEVVTVSVCGLRPGAVVDRLDFVNMYTLQTYTYEVYAVVDQQGCVEIEIELGNMSYGVYNVVVYEKPAPPPDPLKESAVIHINETGLITVYTGVVTVNAKVEAEFTTTAYWWYKKKETVESSGTSISHRFVAEDGVLYTLLAFIESVDGKVYVRFRLYDADAINLIDLYDVEAKEVDGVYVGEWEFSLADKEVPDLHNNKAVFRCNPAISHSTLELYYGGRKLVVEIAQLTIRYTNLDTNYVVEYYYEYPTNLSLGYYGLELVETPYWDDADVRWKATFVWDGITGVAELTVYAQYLPRTILFEDKYRVEPVIYLNGEPVESGSLLELWTVYDYLVEFYGFTPDELFIIEVNGNVVHYGFIDADGNASYMFTVPLDLLDRGYWYTVRITCYYGDGVETREYVVSVLVAHPAIYVNYMLVEPDSTVDLGYLSPGHSIVIEARGFPPYTTLNMYLNGVPIAELVTDEYGNFYQTFVIGDLPVKYGEQNVVKIVGLYDGVEYTAYITFTVPAIYLNNVLVMPDEVIDLGYLHHEAKIKIEAKGFPPHTPVTIWLNNILVGTFETDRMGALTRVLAIRDLPVNYGVANTLMIKAVYDTTEYIAYATFTVPAIYINGILVMPGETVNLGYVCPVFTINVEARGFPPYTPITIYLNGRLFGVFETDETGIFVETFIVGDLPFKYNATNTLTVLAVYNSVEYHAYADFTIPGVFVDGTLVGFDEVYDAGVIPGVKAFRVEAYNFPPNIAISVYLNGSLVGTYYTSGQGYAMILLDAHKSMYPGGTGVYTIIAQYNGCTYSVQVSFTIQETYSYFKLVNPITGETLTPPKASAGYYNKTLIVTLNGEPFDYLGDIIEIYIDGLGPGERIVVKLVRGLLELVIYDGVARKDGTLLLELTVPSIPRGRYSVVAYLPERGYSITIPWSEDPKVKEFYVYPKIVVTRLETYEVPVTIGSIAVRIFGSGFDENIERFIVLLNGTDAIAAVNYHTYAFWRTNAWGLLVGPGSSQTGLTIPVLEPGVYAITIYAVAGDYTAGTGYVIVLNNLANVATKEDIEGVVSALETISANLYEVLTRLDVVEATLSEVASNIMILIDKQNYVIEILEELRHVVATKDDISNVVSYLELLGGRIDDLYLTMVALYEQLNARLDDLEMYLATLISQLESKLLERTYELEDLMIYLYTLLQERIDSLELALLNRIAESESNIIQTILEVEQGLMKKLSDLEQLVDYVYTSLTARIEDLEVYISSRLDILELWLEELTELVLEVHDSLYSRIDELEEAVSMAIAELENTLMARIDELESSLTDLLDARTEYLEALITNVNETILADLEELEELVYERTDYLALLIESVNASLNARLAELEWFVDTRISDIEMQLSELATLILEVHDSLQNRITQLEETLTNITIELEYSIMARIDELESSMKDYIDVKAEYLASLMESVNTTILARIDRLESNLNASITYLETKIENINRTLTDLIISRMESLASMVGDVNATLASMINNVTALIYERTGRLESLIATVNETISTRIAGLEARMITEFDSVKAMISGVNATLTARIIEANTTLHARIDRLESLVLREVDALESLINTTRRELSGLINATASYIVDYVSREIDILESQVATNMTALGSALRLYIDERISELNGSITVTLRLHGERLEYIEEALLNVTYAIEDLRSDMYTEVGRVRTEIDVKYDEMSRKIGELDERVGVAISTSEEARSLASTTMTISTITLVLVVASLAIAVLTFMKLRKAR